MGQLAVKAKSGAVYTRTPLRRLTARSGLTFHLREAALILGLCLLYAAVSILPRDGIEHVARQNAETLIAFERGVGVFREVGWNGWVAGVGGWVAAAFSWLYILTFMAVIPLAALAYYVADRGRYCQHRNVVVISLLLAIVAHAIFPVAPPRMMTEFGFVDTMKFFGPGWYDMRDVVGYFNAHAAMPSLHFAWALFFGVLFVRLRGKLLKVMGIVYPAITLASIVVTANHYLLDAAAGALLMALAYWIHHAIGKTASLSKWRPSVIRDTKALPSLVRRSESVKSRG